MRMKLMALTSVFLLGTTGAFATTILTGGYSVSEQYTSAQGGPSISYGLSNTAFSQTLTPVSYTHLTLPTKRIV